MLYAIRLLKRIIETKDDLFQVIKLSKITDEPARLEDLVLSEFEQDVFNFPIAELNIAHIDNLLSFNKSATHDNYQLKSLVINYNHYDEESHNQLYELNFDKFKALKKLHLINNNQISQNKTQVSMCILKSSMFDQLTSLEELKIDDFTIILSKNQFVNLKSLKKLSLNNINLSEINLNKQKKQNRSEQKVLCHQWFDILDISIAQQLVELDLSLCSLKLFDLLFLFRFINLKKLDLSYNNISFDGICYISFCALKKLVELKLDHNKIPIINEEFTSGLVNIETLSLSNCKIKRISKRAFSNLKKIKSLDVANNNFKIIKDSFKWLSSLEHLFLSNDLLAQLETIKIMPNLKTINFTETFKRMDHNRERFFEGAECLEIIDAYHANFSREYPKSLEKLKNLKELTIQLEFNGEQDPAKVIGDILSNKPSLTKINISVLPGLDLLRLSSLSSCDLTNLTELRLNNSSIKSLDEDLFSGLDNLKCLSLSSNELEYLDGRRLFRNLHKLEKLEMGNNKIKVIKPNSFDSLENLKHLFMLSNEISELDCEIFHKLINLEYLGVQTNQFSMKKDHFKNLKKLNNLEIICSNYPLDSDVFTYLTWLKFLQIASCEFNQMEEGLFSHLTSLKHLEIRDSTIKSISQKAFSKLNSLRKMDFHFNKMSSLRDVSIEDLTELTSLSIVSNQGLETFDFDVIDKLPNLKHFVFYQDRIKIDHSNKIRLSHHFRFNQIHYFPNDSSDDDMDDMDMDDMDIDDMDMDD